MGIVCSSLDMTYTVELLVVIWVKIKPLVGYMRGFTGLDILKMHASGANNVLNVQ